MMKRRNTNEAASEGKRNDDGINLVHLEVVMGPVAGGRPPGRQQRQVQRDRSTARYEPAGTAARARDGQSLGIELHGRSSCPITKQASQQRDEKRKSNQIAYLKGNE